MPIKHLNYGEHVKLKYNYELPNMSKSLHDLLFFANVEDAIDMEDKINKKLPFIPNFKPNEWEYYLKYAGFPSFFFIMILIIFIKI